MQTLSFQAPEEMNALLESFAKEMDRSKGYLIRQALAEYLEELEDLREARHYREAAYNPKENISLAALKQRHKLDE